MKKASLVLIIALLVSWCGCSSPAIPSATGSSPVTTNSDTSTTLTTIAVVDWSPDGVIEAGEYSGSNSYGEFTVFWRSDDKFLYVGITARTTGWVAIAFQPGERMKDADMIIGMVKEGKAEVRDLYCVDDFGRHPEDIEIGGTDDILASGGKEESGFTTIEFKRALTTNDKYDIPVTKSINKIMWAYSTNDNMTVKHFTKGNGKINP